MRPRAVDSYGLVGSGKTHRAFADLEDRKTLCGIALEPGMFWPEREGEDCRTCLRSLAARLKRGEATS